MLFKETYYPEFQRFEGQQPVQIAIPSQFAPIEFDVKFRPYSSFLQLQNGLIHYSTNDDILFLSIGTLDLFPFSLSFFFYFF